MRHPRPDDAGHARAYAPAYARTNSRARTSAATALLATLLTGTLGCSPGPIAAGATPAGSATSTASTAAMAATASTPVGAPRAGTAATPANSSASAGSSPSSPASTSSSPGSPTPSPTAAAPDVPPLSAAAQAAGLVDVRTVVPDAVIDLRYATTNNITGVQIYPTGARCLVHASMIDGLTAAARVLRTTGSVLVFWDCYRPHDAQIRLWNVVPDPAWVARPGPSATSHEAGRSVDVTLADAATGTYCDMGTGFDDFSPKATAYATAGLSAAQSADRARLRAAMAAGGLPIYSGEWWHFNGPGSGTPRPHLGVPVA